MDTVLSVATLQVNQLARDLAHAIEPKPERDDIFYFDTIVFKVENTLFRVPRHKFELPGSFFATMFTLPVPEGNEVEIEGTSDKNPIIVEGISKSHFKAFLKILYPLLFKSLADPGLAESTSITIDQVQRSNTTYEEWVGILHLATKWDFFDIRRKAIQSITRMMPQDMTMWEKIGLAKKYHVKAWLLDEYKKIIIPVYRASLDVNGLLSGGMNLSDIVKIFKIREEYGVPCVGCGHSCLGSNSGYYHQSNCRIRPNLDKIIPEQFMEEFVGMLDA